MNRCFLQGLNFQQMERDFLSGNFLLSEFFLKLKESSIALEQVLVRCQQFDSANGWIGCQSQVTLTGVTLPVSHFQTWTLFTPTSSPIWLMVRSSSCLNSLSQSFGVLAVSVKKSDRVISKKSLPWDLCSIFFMDNAWLKVGGGHKIGCLLSVVHSVPTHGEIF